MTSFTKPHKSGSNMFMCQVVLVHFNLLDKEECFKQFEGATIIGLKRNIINYCKAYGYMVSEMSDIFVIHEETTYTRVEGFTLKDNTMKEVMI